MSLALQTTNLTHAFSSEEQTLQSVNLAVPQGSIYGFLGPNGAGKTTTLKLVLGLLRRQQGEISILGRSLATDRIDILRRIGSLIEMPSFYGHLTATENLETWRLLYQCPHSRIKEVLDLVGLSKTNNKPSRKFSLGMKQRLGIAAAILHRPEFLILDEPTNGLDPNGMVEIRQLLQILNREEKMTILISSHLLSEIAKLVTHVGIINRGRLVFQDTLPTLLEKKKEATDDLETIFMNIINN